MIKGCKCWGIWVLLLSMILQSCQGQGQAGETGMQKLSGATMGTTWHLTYEGATVDVTQKQIDEVLESINLAASTYIPESIISRLNKGEIVDIGQEDPNQIEFFRYNIEICDSVWQWSNGFFDPTVMPLVNYWGFGYTGHRPIEEVDSAYIDSLLRYVGYDQVADRFGGDIWVLPDGFQLDFSAVAKGAASDWIGKFLEDQGITNYLIEIGGEIVAKGPGRAGDGWVVGISKPEINAPTRDLIEYLAMKDRGLATSGNYRNYYESQGRIITHTINPKTGYSEERRILSATIVAQNCALADALATAIMALGIVDGKAVIEQIPEIEAYLVYKKEDGGTDVRENAIEIFETEGMKSLKYNTRNP